MHAAHKNVKAFISHCGQGGVYEAIDSATPIVTIPLFYDQPSNAAILENLNVAVRLDLESVSEERVLIALNAIINDTKYVSYVRRIRNEEDTMRRERERGRKSESVP